MSVHENTLQGLKEILEYVNGDKSKARSVIVETSDDDINTVYLKLSESDQKKTMRYAKKLLKAANE